MPGSKRRGSTKLLNRGKAQLTGTEHTLLTQQRLIPSSTGSSRFPAATEHPSPSSAVSLLQLCGHAASPRRAQQHGHAAHTRFHTHTLHLLEALRLIGSACSCCSFAGPAAFPYTLPGLGAAVSSQTAAGILLTEHRCVQVMQTNTVLTRNPPTGNGITIVAFFPEIYGSYIQHLVI